MDTPSGVNSPACLLPLTGKAVHRQLNRGYPLAPPRLVVLVPRANSVPAAHGDVSAPPGRACPPRARRRIAGGGGGRPLAKQLEQHGPVVPPVLFRRWVGSIGLVGDIRRRRSVPREDVLSWLCGAFLFFIFVLFCDM